MPSPGDEPVDLIDRDDRVIGWAPRREVRSRNLLHRGVGILCRNRAGEIYVHRRTSTKDVFPSLYDMFVGGVVGRGEDWLAAATREIAEELGIVGPVPEERCVHLYEGPHNRSLVRVYEVEWDGPIVHQASEVAWGAFLTREDLDSRVREARPDPEARSESRWTFVPDGLEIWLTHFSAPDVTGASSARASPE